MKYRAGPHYRKVVVLMLTFALPMLGGVRVLAQQAATLTLQQTIALALGQNPDREIAKSSVDDAEVSRKLARTALLPSVHFDESVTRGNDPVYVFGAKLRQQVFTQSDFTLNNLNRPQPLNDFATQFAGSWAVFDSWHTQLEIHKADLLAKSAHASASRTDQEIMLRTIRAYENVLLLIQQAETAEHEVATARALLEASVTRVEAGLTVDADQLSARAYLAEREQEQIAARGAVEVGWAELEAAIGQAIPSDQRQLAPLSEKTFDSITLTDEKVLALKTRPDRKSVEFQGEAARTNWRSAEASFGPQVSAYGNWEIDRPSVVGAAPDDWTAGFEVRIDLLPAGKRQDLAAAKIALTRASATKASADREIQLQVTRAYYDHQAAMQMLAVARASTGQTVESLRTLRDRYTAGLATMTDLMRTQDAERRSRTNYSQAVFQIVVTYAALRFADGTLNQDIAGELQ